MFTLTDFDRSLGVTRESAENVRTRGLVFDAGRAFAAPKDSSPAVDSAAARIALGPLVEYAGINGAGHPVYRRVDENGRYA